MIEYVLLVWYRFLENTKCCCCLHGLWKPLIKNYQLYEKICVVTIRAMNMYLDKVRSVVLNVLHFLCPWHSDPVWLLLSTLVGKSSIGTPHMICIFLLIFLGWPAHTVLRQHTLMYALLVSHDRMTPLTTSKQGPPSYGLNCAHWQSQLHNRPYRHPCDVITIGQHVATVPIKTQVVLSACHLIVPTKHQNWGHILT